MFVCQFRGTDPFAVSTLGLSIRLPPVGGVTLLTVTTTPVDVAMLPAASLLTAVSV